MNSHNVTMLTHTTLHVIAFLQAISRGILSVLARHTGTYVYITLPLAKFDHQAGDIATHIGTQHRTSIYNITPYSN